MAFANSFLQLAAISALHSTTEEAPEHFPQRTFSSGAQLSVESQRLTQNQPRRFYPVLLPCTPPPARGPKEELLAAA